MFKARSFLVLALGLAMAIAHVQAASWQDVPEIRASIGNVTPIYGQLIVELPGVVDDGSSLPLSVHIQHPMTSGNFIASIHVFAPLNPQVEVLDLQLSNVLGRAAFSTRVRINESQTVYAVARTNQGEVYIGSTDIRVATGGCAMVSEGPSEVFGPARVAPMRDAQAGVPQEVRTLISHPMETGRRQGQDGSLVARNLLESFVVEYNGEQVLRLRYHTAMAENPFFQFYLTPESSTQAKLLWTEETSGRKIESVLNIDLI